MRGSIIVSSAAVLALVGCSAVRMPAARSPAASAGGPGRRTVLFPETAFSRGILERDQQQATLQGPAAPLSEEQPRTPAPCGLLMEDVPDGLALVFTDRQESVATLRQRVHEIAARYNSGAPDARQLTQDLMDMQTRTSARASVQNVPGGARLVLSTHKAGEVEALRALMRWHAAELLPGVGVEAGHAGPCPSLPKPLMG